MPDFNKILTPGDYSNNQINVVVEIPAGSHNKIEWDPEKACFMLDRVEPRVFARPCNYGFIPQTTGEDGDELDALLLTDVPLPTGIAVNAHVLGVMKFNDSGEVDDKIICVPYSDRKEGNYMNDIDDLPKSLLKQIEFFFNHYKDLRKPHKETKVERFGDAAEAREVIAAAAQRWQK